jgi:ABC-type branched-subunit amino acid transport system substrate-binding protein
MTFVEEQQQRLLRGVVQCQEVINAKRRLGGDASDKELADDKRIARRVQHRLRTSANEWLSITNSTKLPQPDGSGMRLIWRTWWEEWEDNVDEAVHTRAEDRRQQHLLERELEGLAQVFADLR